MITTVYNYKAQSCNQQMFYKKPSIIHIHCRYISLQQNLVFWPTETLTSELTDVQYIIGSYCYSCYK